MKLKLVGGPTRIHPGIVRWAGHRVQCTPHRFDRIVHLSLGDLSKPIEVDRDGVQRFAEDMQSCDALMCEVPEACLLAMEWRRLGLPPRPIVALEVHGLARVRPLVGWFRLHEQRDPWSELVRAPWISVVAASLAQRNALLAAGLGEERIHRIDGCTGLFEMILPGARRRLDGGRQVDAGDARGLPRDAVLVAGSGRRDPLTYLRAAVRLPRLSFVVLDPEIPKHRHLLEPEGLLDLPHVRFLAALPLERYIALVRRARIVVVSVLAGGGDGGHTTIATAHRLGVPLVCSTVPGLADYVTHAVDAWMVPPGDPVRLAEGILTLWDDASLCQRLSCAGRRREMGRVAALRTKFNEALSRAVDGLPRKRSAARRRPARVFRRRA